MGRESFAVEFGWMSIQSSSSIPAPIEVKTLNWLTKPKPILHRAYAYGNMNKRLCKATNKYFNGRSGDEAITSLPPFPLYSFFVPYIRRPPRFPGTHNAKRRKMKAGNTYNTHSITEKPPPVSKTRSVTCSCHYIDSHFPISSELRKKSGGKLLLPNPKPFVTRPYCTNSLPLSLSLSSQGMCTFLPLVCFSNGRLLLHRNYTCPPHFSFTHLPCRKEGLHYIKTERHPPHNPLHSENILMNMYPSLFYWPREF